MTRNPYIDATRVRAALRALELRPTRAMGQNFLIDDDVLEAIVAAAEIEPDTRVVEVGPGLGVLTHELVQRAAHVTAVELDARLAARLRAEFAHEPRLSIVEQDILRVPPATLAAGKPYRVVANLPYAITSSALRHFLDAAPRPDMVVVLVQWEVALRIAAAPGDLSVLAHAMQIYTVPEVVRRVPAAAFMPTPDVDSAILRLRVRPEPAVADPTRVMRVLKAGFLHPRKQLGNALGAGLAAAGMGHLREHALSALAAAGIAPERRAETVTLAEWEQVAQALG